MEAIKLTGSDAVRLVELLQGVSIYVIRTREQLVGEVDPDPISPEEAAALCKEGNGHKVLVPVTQGVLSALIGKIANYQNAFTQADAQLDALSERVLEERAKFIRDAAARLVTSLIKEPTHFLTGYKKEEVVAAAVDWAEALDAEIWRRAEKEINDVGS